jgi:hypothetical protein
MSMVDANRAFQTLSRSLTPAAIPPAEVSRTHHHSHQVPYEALKTSLNSEKVSESRLPPPPSFIKKLNHPQRTVLEALTRDD